MVRSGLAFATVFAAIIGGRCSPSRESEQEAPGVHSSDQSNLSTITPSLTVLAPSPHPPHEKELSPIVGGPPPAVTCSIAQATLKAPVPRSAECHWRGAEKHYWGKKEPTSKVAVTMYAGKDPAAVAEAFGAVSVEPLVRQYAFIFRTPREAVDALRGLMCHPDVNIATMILTIKADDNGPMYDWCDTANKVP